MRIKILVRKNLKMSPEKTAAQCVHAALGLTDPDPLMSVIVLQISDKKFEEAKLAHPDGHVVKDAGFTEVAAGTETCIAFYEIDPRRVELKICSECRIPKEETEFHRKLDTEDWLAAICKDCAADKKKEYRENNIDHVRKLELAQRNVDPAKSNLKARKAMHKLSYGAWEYMLKLQKGLCAICSGTLPLEQKYATRVDHIHGESCESGHRDEKHGCRKCIRGIICSRCDHSDVPAILRAKADYIERMQNPQNRPLYCFSSDDSAEILTEESQEPDAGTL